MRIERLKDKAQAREAWDRFVTDSNNGTVFHTLRFLSYHPEDRFEHHHLTVYKRNRLLAVIPGALRDAGDGISFVSHPGASYGGAVLPDPFSFEDATALSEALLAYGRENGFNAIDLTLPPVPYMNNPDQAMEYALVGGGFQYRKREFTSIVPLDLSAEEVFDALPQKTRADVRQAGKLNLRVDWRDDPSDDDLEVMYRMLLENRRDLGLDTPPAHSLEDLARIRELVPGMLFLGLTYSGDDPVASTLVFRCNDRVLLTFYICHERKARDAHPVHLMLYELICEGTRQGYRFVDFGISTVNMKPLRSLIRFKESFRSHGFFRDTFEKKL